MTERLLVVNADDFGLAPGISRGILDAHDVGVVTSTSAMVTLPAWGVTSRMLQGATSSLGVGLHFDMLTGQPLVADGTLVSNATGRFHTYPELLRRIVSGRISSVDVERECGAQIARLRASLMARGAAITHIDSHRHTHVLPVIAAGVRRAAERAGIDTIRSPVERLMRGTNQLGRARVVMLRALSSVQRSPPASLSRGFLGAAWQGDGDFPAHLLRISEHLNSPVTELMCHPGYVDDTLRQIDGFTLHRELELGALCCSGLRDHWERAGIRLVNFGQLRSGFHRKSPEPDKHNDPHHEARDRADAIR